MATLASIIVDKAELILKDSSNGRWGSSELLDWLIEGEGIVVMFKPDANAVQEAVVLSSGTLQSLPATATQLLDVTYNMGLTPGTTYGDAISLIDRGTMDACYPGWQTEAASLIVKHVIYDPIKLPKKFWVYPKSGGTNYIQIITAKIPGTIASLATNINLSDEYTSALMDWVLFRAFQKDAEYNPSVERALTHLDSFRTQLGIRESLEEKFAPRRSQGGLA